jgi:hypothetical protein
MAVWQPGCYGLLTIVDGGPESRRLLRNRSVFSASIGGAIGDCGVFSASIGDCGVFSASIGGAIGD